jgi:hypothetical protein
MTVLIFSAVGVAILVSLFWLLFAPKWDKPRAEIEALDIEKLQPLHCRHFPQISQLLRPDDLIFIGRRAPASMARAWSRERRRILRQYLNGLAEDYIRVGRLARLIASLSPELSRKQEWEWFWMGLQFQAVLQLLRLNVTLGSLSLAQLTRWTDFVSSQAADLEIRMSQLAGILPSRLRTSPGA